MMHNTNKERVERYWIKRKHKDRYVPRFEPLALRPRLHYREGFLIH